MESVPVQQSVRRPRFRRAAAPPPFRLTDDDIEIIRHIARHRFLRSTHIAVLVGRSLDRTNDRLLRLFHAGYVDRPRAQLDRFPTSGTAPMLYALADRGARLLRQRDDLPSATVEWSRKNRKVQRPFIDHQIEIVDFQIALQRTVSTRADVRLFFEGETSAAASRRQGRETRPPFALSARIEQNGTVRSVSAVPDSVFALQFADGTRHNYTVEIDRGTMPVFRSDPEQTSIARKMRVYLAAHTAKQHQREFGWTNFRVLFVTTNQERIETMIDASRQSQARRHGVGVSLFWFSTFAEIKEAADFLSLEWCDGNRRAVRLAQ
jgi:hypothetical protein